MLHDFAPQNPAVRLTPWPSSTPSSSGRAQRAAAAAIIAGSGRSSVVVFEAAPTAGRGVPHRGADRARVPSRRVLGDPSARASGRRRSARCRSSSTACGGSTRGPARPPARLARRGGARTARSTTRPPASGRRRGVAAADGAARAGRDADVDGLMSPLSVPRHPVGDGPVRPRPGCAAPRRRATPASTATGAPALLAGLAAHSILPLDRPLTAGVRDDARRARPPRRVAARRKVGRRRSPTRSSRSSPSTAARSSATTGSTSLADLPPARVVLADVGAAAARRHRRRPPPRPRTAAGCERFRYGPGVFKLDYALSGPVPWADPGVAAGGDGARRRHDRRRSPPPRRRVAAASIRERPFVLVAQPSLFDPTGRRPGRHTLWAYCHVPAGSTVDMTDRIDAQIERFAPGFRRRRDRPPVTLGPAALEAHNPNYVGGDITGGVTDWRQFVARPTLSLHPWRTPVAGLYLCSASTPPGAGVHGMCGLHAARLALRRLATDASGRRLGDRSSCSRKSRQKRPRQRDRATRRPSRIASWIVRGATQSPAWRRRRRAAGRSGRRKPQSTSAAHGIVRRAPEKRSSTSTAPSASRTARSSARRSMRTPAWARRTLAGARSPVRGQLVAGDVVLGDEDRPRRRAPRRGRRRSARRSGRTARRRRRRADVADAASGTSATSSTPGPRRRPRTRASPATRPGALHDHLAARPPRRRPSSTRAARRRRRRGDLGLPATDERAGRARRRRPARRGGPSRSTSGTGCPRAGGHPRRLQTGRPAADDDDVARATAAGAYQSGILGLPPRRRLADARDDRVARVAHLARLVAAGARADPLGLAGAGAWRRGRGRRSGPGSSRRPRTPTSSPSAHSACPTSTTEPCRNTGTSTAVG